MYLPEDPSLVQCNVLMYYTSCISPVLQDFHFPKKENIKKELANCKELHEKSSIPHLEVTDNH